MCCACALLCEPGKGSDRFSHLVGSRPRAPHQLTFTSEYAGCGCLQDYHEALGRSHVPTGSPVTSGRCGRGHVIVRQVQGTTLHITHGAQRSEHPRPQPHCHSQPALVNLHCFPRRRSRWLRTVAMSSVWHDSRCTAPTRAYVLQTAARRSILQRAVGIHEWCSS